MIVVQEIQQTQNSIKTTKNNQVWYIKRNYAQLYLNVSVKVSVIFKSGDGRTRTAVQTPHQTAFYTLSLTLIFDRELPSDRPFTAYPSGLGGA